MSGSRCWCATAGSFSKEPLLKMMREEAEGPLRVGSQGRSGPVSRRPITDGTDVFVN